MKRLQAARKASGLRTEKARQRYHGDEQRMQNILGNLVRDDGDTIIYQPAYEVARRKRPNDGAGRRDAGDDPGDERSRFYRKPATSTITTKGALTSPS